MSLPDDHIKTSFISESVENFLIPVLNLYQSVIPNLMVVDFFKQFQIEKWKWKRQKVRHGCTVSGPASEIQSYLTLYKPVIWLQF